MAMGSCHLYLVDIDSVIIKRHQRAEGALSNDDGDAEDDAEKKKKKNEFIFYLRSRNCLDQICLADFFCLHFCFILSILLYIYS